MIRFLFAFVGRMRSPFNVDSGSIGPQVTWPLSQCSMVQFSTASALLSSGLYSVFPHLVTLSLCLFLTASVTDGS